MTTWKETSLWHSLEKLTGAGAESVRAHLSRWMPDVEHLLAASETAPSDFTLHDDGHAFRVAQWMTRIIPEHVVAQLSPYEHALLLLSAFLHDVGMTPQLGKTRQLQKCLLFEVSSPPLPDDLNVAEVAALQRWLDEDGRGFSVPLTNGEAKAEHLALCAQLLTHFMRSRHNEWGEQWTRTFLCNDQHALYDGWVSDLVLVCKSHHYGYDDLKTERFDPRPAPAGNVIHLRYLACVLRLADILEIDPKRTPEVVFKHRDISPGSILYWRKDHETWLSRDGETLHLIARPSSALIEKAIRTTGDAIAHELEVCSRLSKDKPFSLCSFRHDNKLPHEWDYPNKMLADIRPLDEAYYFIDGSFRPNTAKLLELLSGNQLYNNRMAAIRELVQNALDAIREETASQLLTGSSSSLTTRRTALESLYKVELRLEKEGDNYWLQCTDNGVGMTLPIIRDHLLVSGSPKRPEVSALERRCHTAGFSLGRTGQFGIGVLSYFMLADQVEVRSRRSMAYGDAEPTGWLFESYGVGSFGELRRHDKTNNGTQVRLRLRKGLFQNAATFYLSLCDYVKTIVRRLPCQLSITSPLAECVALDLDPGWSENNDQRSAMVREQCLKRYYDDHDEFDGIPYEVSLIYGLPSFDRLRMSGTLETFRENVLRRGSG